MITEDYVSYETAKLLKEKGFDEDIARVVNEEGEIDYLGSFQPSLAYLYHTWYRCPTLQMAMKWLRKTHNIVMYITPNIEFENEYDVRVNVKWFIEKWAGVRFKSYELACEAGVKYCLENLI